MESMTVLLSLEGTLQVSVDDLNAQHVDSVAMGLSMKAKYRNSTGS